jgi:hypothetical protein
MQAPPADLLANSNLERRTVWSKRGHWIDLTH